MMRFFKAAGIGVLLMVPYFLFGCAGSSHKDLKPHTTLNHVNFKKNAYDQKAAIVLGATPGTAVGRQLGELYLQTLIRTIHKENHRVRLIGQQDSGFPQFLKALANSSEARNISKMAELSRAQGFQGLMRASVLEIQPTAKKTGVFWFRKTRYFITFGLSLDLYDPFSGAKLLSAVREKTIKVDLDEYEALKEQNDMTLEDLNESVADMAEDFGEEAADTFKAQPWKVSVAAVRNGRVFLASGAQAGLKVGDRLAVFQARRTIEGPEGKKFIIPGYQVGEIQVTALDDQMVEAAAGADTDIREGDIAVPIH